MKKRKYTYLYVLQGNYGHGFEDLTAEDKANPGALKRIRQDRRDYIENDGTCSLRIINRRVPNDE